MLLIFLALTCLFGAVVANSTPGTPLQGLPESFNCDACLWAFNFAYDKFGSETGADVATYLLSSICDTISTVSDKLKCQQFIEAEWKSTFSWLKQKLNPELACTHLQVCDYYVDPSFNAQCEVCQLGVRVVEDIVKTPALEELVVSSVDMVCGNLGWLISSVCSLILEDTIRWIVGDISSALPPYEVCRILKEC